VTDPLALDQHHDAIEFPDGSRVLVTLLCAGQRASVLQLPVVRQARESAPSFTGITAATPVSVR